MPEKIVDTQAEIDATSGEGKEYNTVQWVRQLRSTAKNVRSADDARRAENMRYYLGGKKHWEGQRRPSYRASITDNRCFSVVESVLPIVTDARPKTEFAAREKEDIQSVELL